MGEGWGGGQLLLQHDLHSLGLPLAHPSFDTLPASAIVTLSTEPVVHMDAGETGSAVKSRRGRAAVRGCILDP
jgi:hypothetical protein